MRESWRRVILNREILPYEVSNQGQVRRLPGPDGGGHTWPLMIMSQHTHRAGYKQLGLRWVSQHGRKSKVIVVHKLVAFAFLEPPPGQYGRGKIAINHKNSIKSDNRAENLEWVTYQQNSNHAMINGRMSVGESNPNSRFTNDDVLEIRRRFDAGESMRSLARSFNSSRCPIMMICKRLTWKHL